MPVPLTDVSVSIQLESVHVSAGLLGDRDLVLVPAPPRQLLDPSRDLHVVVIPEPLEAGYPVERLRASCINVMWLGEDRERAVAAMLKLAVPSGYSPSMGSFNGATLALALERAGNDLWTALESLGTIGPGRRSGPSPDILARLPEVERAQRQATYRDHEYPSGTEIGWSICRWLCICHPH
jgi:hypothetical protein